MDSTLLKQFNSFLHRDKARLNLRLAVFLFFLVISIVLWYLNKLNSDYITEVEYPVSFVNPPRNKIMVGTPPKSITLKVSGFGYSLIRFNLATSLSPIIIDINSLVVQNVAGSKTKMFILTSRARSAISSQLSSDIQLLSVLPDSLFFEFSDLVRKKVKVIPSISVDFKRQHMLSGSIICNPDSVVVTGPKAVIDTVNEVYTQKKSFINISTTESKSLNLTPLKQVGFSHRKVDITVPAEKFTEMVLDIPITPANLNEGIGIILLPPSIKLRVNVPIGKASEIKPHSFSAIVNLADISTFQSNKIRVELKSIPENVSLVDFNPKIIQFYIEKK